MTTSNMGKKEYHKSIGFTPVFPTGNSSTIQSKERWQEENQCVLT